MPETVINLIILAVVLLIVIACICYIVREKKRGAKCIGCPYAQSCGKSSCDCSPEN